MRLLILCAIILASNNVLANGHKSNLDKLSVKGEFQWRTETATNRRGIQGARQSEQSFSRLRTFVTYQSSDQLKINLTPQAAKGFGADEGTTVTSGTPNHSDLTFLESNIQYQMTKDLEVKLGRQQIAYGEHFIIGKRPWNNTSAAFDAIKFRYKLNRGWIDGAFSKISDDGSPRVSNDDTDFAWLYSSFDFGELLREVDLYFMHQDNDGGTSLEVNTFGFRMKGTYGDVFYRTENGLQKGINVGVHAYQYDFEIGRKFDNYSISAEWAASGHDYREMYPNPHKWLGFADLFSRRNIRQVALHLKGELKEWLTFRLDYHKFDRVSSDDPVYSFFNGTSWGTNSSSSDIGSEVDFVMNFLTKDNLKMSLGYALFMPGTYMKQNQNDLDENTRFMYAQIRATF